MPTITLAYSPFPYQREFHDSTARFKLVVGGRRSGKSLGALHELVKRALTVADVNAWWVSPTLSDARDVGFDVFKEELSDDLRPLIQYTNEQRMLVRFRNGSRITFKGSESEQALRGRALTDLVIDEAAFVAEAMWKRALRPALADRAGRAVLCSTPNGLNWLHRLWEDAATRANWQRFHWPSWINPTLGADELEDAKATLDPREWQQEFAAEFVTRAGQVYPDFSAENIVEPFSPTAAEHHVYLGLDPGFATKAAVVFVAVPSAQDHRVNQRDLRVTVFDELYLQRCDTHQVLDRVAAVLAKHGLAPRSVSKVFVDPTNADTASIVQRFGYLVGNEKTEIDAGVALVRSLMLSAAGTRRLFVTRNCVEMIRSVRGYSYATTRGDQPKEAPLKDGQHDHLCDALRYVCIHKFNQGSDVARLLRMAQM
jgi:hypothetical protein